METTEVKLANQMTGSTDLTHTQIAPFVHTFLHFKDILNTTLNLKQKLTTTRQLPDRL